MMNNMIIQCSKFCNMLLLIMIAYKFSYAILVSQIVCCFQSLRLNFITIPGPCSEMSSAGNSSACSLQGCNGACAQNGWCESTAIEAVMRLIRLLFLAAEIDVKASIH